MAHPSWHPMNPRNANKNAFPSIFREAQVPQSSQASLPSHRFHEHMGTFSTHKTIERNSKQNKNLISLVKWCIDWFINRIFSSYPLWIQSIMTAIIGFISYFLYDFSIGLQSLSFYIIYKAMSFIGFLTSVFFVYVVLINMNNKKASDSKMNEKNPKSELNPALNAIQNPYSMRSGAANNKSRQPQQTSSSSTNYLKPKGNDLYFTTKSMLNRVSSQVLNRENEKKLDYNSSPQKIESLDPTQIATHKNLNKFIASQRKKEDVYGTPINNGTPIGKTFGSMRMTPAHSSTAPHLNTWSTPNKTGLNKTNQGSAALYTPNSSMDVTMISYENELNMTSKHALNEEPFNVDFSVIEPKQQRTSSAAWNVSAFGAMGLGDLSMMAQPGTPAKNMLNLSGVSGTPMSNNNYVYDGMYSDINLRGENIGHVKQQQQQQQVLIQQQQQQNKHNKNNVAEVSPFSRKRRSVVSAADSDLAQISAANLMKNDFSAYYMEKSIDLYRKLRVDGLVENWAESMRWWLSQNVLKMRNNELITNENDINNEIFSLLCARYNLAQQLSELRSISQKEAFIVSNESSLINVARQVNKPSIMRIIQKRKHLKECIDFICSNYSNNNMNNNNNNNKSNNSDAVNEYVYQRIAALSSTNNLTLYNWNSGTDKKWRNGLYPSDAELIMKLFCRYMDDIMCPAIKFSQKHYFEIPRVALKKLNKFLNKNICVKDIAIICVRDYHHHNNLVAANESAAAAQCLPYFFLAFDKKKFSSKIKHFGGFNPVSMAPFAHESHRKLAQNKKESTLIRKPRHYLFGAQAGEEKEFENDDDDGRISQTKNGTNKDSVCATWFPQPGKMNLIHTITLFALFIHRYCNDKLTGIALKDQGCTLLQPIFK